MFEYVVAALIFVAFAVGSAGQAARPRIRVGPNVRVSRSSVSPRVEMQIAANPVSSKNLLATAIATDLDADHCVVYASLDGGTTWREHTFTDLPETGSGDPQVAFGPDGAAYFTALSQVHGQDGRMHFAVLMFRSSDGGATWAPPVTIGSGYAPDHEQMTVEPRGRHTGRVLLAASYRTPLDPNNIGLFAPDDAGYVKEPLHVASGAGAALFSLNPLVLSDGTLFVPALVSEPKPIEERKTPTADIAFALSSDDGSSFSSLKTIRTQRLDSDYKVGSPYASVVFAVDAEGPHRDRIYMVWGDAGAGHYHLKVSYSSDRGATWSEARTVGDPAADTDQFRPAIAVSRSGMVGISWLDTRLSRGSRAYDAFFTASVDGGETFLPSVRVSRETSTLDAPGNVVLRPTIDTPWRSADADEVTFSFITTQAGFPDGGDYLGLSVDAAGVFHPIWADTRTGSFQAWTSAITVDGPDDRRTRASAGQAVTVTDKVRPLFDAARFDPLTGVEEIPVRWQNISGDTICGSIVAHVQRVSAGRMAADRAEILNGEPDATGAIAAFTYSPGEIATCLRPGEATEPRVWRVRPSPAAKTFVSFTIRVTGALASPR